MSQTEGPGPRVTDSADACSFCGKGKREVKLLIVGQMALICNECLGLCNEIMKDEIEARRAATLADRPPAAEILRELHDLAFRLAKGCRAEPGLPKVIGDVAMTLALALEPPGSPAP
jgi:hypothetical protein